MTLGREKLDVYRLSIDYCVKETPAVYGFEENDFDTDPDFDPEETTSQFAAGHPTVGRD